VIGSVFNLNDKPFTVVGIAPPGFFGDTLRDRPPDFFMPIATEPLLQGTNSWLRVPYAHWLDLIGRIQPRVARASLEAQMRVELKQWLFSHQSDPEMDSNERANLSRQTLYLSPGGAGITSLREKFAGLAQNPNAGFRICARHRVRQRREPHAGARHRTPPTNLAEHRLGSSPVAPHPPSTHRKLGAFFPRSRSRSRGCLCRNRPYYSLCIFHAYRFRERAHQRVAVDAGSAVRLRRLTHHRRSFWRRARVDGRPRGSH
jgi:hypothetical protein